MNRTQKQRAADGLDRDLFNLSRRLEMSASAHAVPEWDDLSRRIFGMRAAVQKHMHPVDLAAAQR